MKIAARLTQSDARHEAHNARRREAAALHELNYNYQCWPPARPCNPLLVLVVFQQMRMLDLLDGSQ